MSARETAGPPTAAHGDVVDGSSGRHLDRAGMLRRWPVLVALVAMWIALWGRLSIANVLGGILVAVAVLAVSGEVKPRPVEHIQVLPALRYLATFARQLVIASYNVVIAVLRPDRIRPGIVAMPLRYASDAVVTLVANSISLTPGTLTLDIERRGDIAVLYVHAMDLTDDDAVRADIWELEKLAVDAFGGQDVQVMQARSLAEYEAAQDGAAREDGSAPDSDPEAGA